MPLEDFAAEMDRCSQCSYCKWIPFDQVKSWRFAKNCPSIAYHNFNSYSARGRYAIGRSLLKGQSGYSDTVREIVYTCLTCGSCDVSCKVCRYNLEPLEMVRELKFRLVEDGERLVEHQAIVDHMKREGNTMGNPRSERGNWANGLDLPRLTSQKAEVLFHAGCRLSFDLEQQKSARAAVDILQKAGVSLGIMGEHEQCCGGRIYSMGYRDEFSRFAKANISAWIKAGVKTVVTSCSDCYHAFKRLYPKLGSQVKVFHTVEYLDRLIREEKLEFSHEIPLTVTYHDPCHLGRQGEAYIPWEGVEKKIKGQIVIYEPNKPRYNGARGIYEPPRNVLKSIPGLNLVEMERNREYSWCCGAGGGVREAYPEFSNWTARERIEEAKACGAEALVTACPWCERNFVDANKMSGDGMAVYDIVDLVQKAI
ncbi:MAG TPA: (Fe-S)-binding protein [Anaerolineales bacterium]|nr:(Fe-S)-binding protein [Anaerolineales bacterium]